MATKKSKSKRSAAYCPPGMDDYQAQDDLHHLTRAAEVRADPKRHKAAVSLAQKRIAQMRQAASVAPDDAAAGGDDGMAG